MNSRDSVDNSIDVSTDQDIRTIEIKGSLSAALSADLEAILSPDNAVKDQKTHIDFSNVSEVTPDAVRVLLNASFNQDETNTLSLKNPNQQVKELMKTVGLDHLIID